MIHTTHHLVTKCAQLTFYVAYAWWLSEFAKMKKCGEGKWGCSSGGVYVPCIYTQVRSLLLYLCYVFRALIKLLCVLILIRICVKKQKQTNKCETKLTANILKQDPKTQTVTNTPKHSLSRDTNGYKRPNTLCLKTQTVTNTPEHSLSKDANGYKHAQTFAV